MPGGALYALFATPNRSFLVLIEALSEHLILASCRPRVPATIDMPTTLTHTLIKHCALALVLLSLLVPEVVGQNKDEAPKDEISICLPELTKLGRIANFHFTYFYRLDVSEKGEVQKIQVVLSPKKQPLLINETKLLDCMQKWKFHIAGKYSVIWELGTTPSIQNSVKITWPEAKSVLEVILPY